jgi:hypothetical protein
LEEVSQDQKSAIDLSPQREHLRRLARREISKQEAVCLIGCIYLSTE